MSNFVEKRPSESAAPAVFALVTGVLAIFGVDPAKAAAIAGIVSSFAPAVVTMLVAKAKPFVETARNAALQVEEGLDKGQEVLDQIDAYTES